MKIPCHPAAPPWRACSSPISVTRRMPATRHRTSSPASPYAGRRSTFAEGRWQYSIDGGANWSNFGFIRTPKRSHFAPPTFALPASHELQRHTEQPVGAADRQLDHRDQRGHAQRRGLRRQHAVQRRRRQRGDERHCGQRRPGWCRQDRHRARGRQLHLHRRRLRLLRLQRQPGQRPAGGEDHHPARRRRAGDSTAPR